MRSEILYGIHPVVEAISACRRDIYEVYIEKGKTSQRVKRALALAESKKIPIVSVKPSALKSITGSEIHQGIGAKASGYAYAKLSEIDDNIQKGRSNGLILLLDNILDPQNLGALIRTALCVQVDGIIIPKDRSALPTPAVSKASAGALEHISLVRVVNMARTMKMLKEMGWWIVGMDSVSDQSIFSSDLTGSVAIVIGGEDKGIRPLVKNHCDFLMSIPQAGPISSLNAAVAGAIAMYEVFRQRLLLKEKMQSDR
ncbi:MAG: 23S rRNA (guanosine(2251)-2'-O)-methyltransferase RlmB [Desulfobacterales bacterium]|nr:MAG: 23S rRNA (guanosine(2251)-2'-O)-methyltransferase RlmB [Desulfobacterales bacterium]